LNPILAEIMPEQVDMKALEEAYNQKVSDYIQEKGITSKDELANLILSGNKFYPVLNERNSAPTIDIAISMADKVMQINNAFVIDNEQY
jgi:hypothetical protein